MRARNLVVFVTLAALIYILFTVSQVTAARETTAFDNQVRALGFSKAVPGQLSYQGYLVNAADSSAVTAILEMTFRLFDTETEGAELWSETHPAVEVSNGLFQVLLGSVNPFPDALFDGSSMWLQTEVGAEVLSPRKPLVSVAYSHRANSAEMLENNTLTDLDDRWVNEGDLDHLNAADGDPDSAVYVNADGNVGIGTIAPDYKLHIISGTHQALRLGTTHSNSHVNIMANPSGGGGLQMRVDGGNNHIAFLTAGIERARVNNNGNVGIGTTSPSYTLDVNGAVRATTYWGDGSNLTGISGTTDNDWTISGNDVYHQTGNVGIGTASPVYPLHVYNYAAYSPSYAGYFHSVGHEATGNAYAVYANAQADDENAYGIYSTAASTWGRAYAGYFVGDVQADSLFLGSASKAGQNGGLLLYNNGAAYPLVELGHHYNMGGKITLSDTSGNWHTRLEPDVDGSGGFLEVYRRTGSWAFIVDGNSGGSEEPWVSISGSSRSVEFIMDNSGDASVMLPSNAVSAEEIENEPGVSNSLGPDFFYMSSGNSYVIDSVDIVIPDAGFVEVTAGCYLNLFHTNGTNTEIWVAIDKTAANVSYVYPGAQVATIPSPIVTSSTWQSPCTTTRLYQEASGGTKRYYLNARYHSGVSTTTNVARSYILAKYYPTPYGTVTIAETEEFEPVFTAAQNQGDGSEPTVEPRRRSISIEDHNARIEAKLQSLRAQLEALKEEVNNQNRK